MGIANISEKYLERFKAIHKKKTGKDISDQDALASFTKLITLVKAIYRPIPKEWLDEYDKKNGTSIGGIDKRNPADN